MDHWRHTKNSSESYYQEKNLEYHRASKVEKSKDNKYIPGIFSAIVTLSLALVKDDSLHSLVYTILDIMGLIHQDWIIFTLPLWLGLLFLLLYKTTKLIGGKMEYLINKLSKKFNPYQNVPPKTMKEEKWAKIFNYEVFHPIASASKMIERLPQGNLSNSDMMVLRESAEKLNDGLICLRDVLSIKPHLIASSTNASDEKKVRDSAIKDVISIAKELTNKIIEYWNVTNNTINYEEDINTLNTNFNNVDSAARIVLD